MAVGRPLLADSFKVESDDGTPGEPASATLNVTKFYDANANGINDDNSVQLAAVDLNVLNGTVNAWCSQDPPRRQAPSLTGV